ncbi:glycosyltransferase [Clostridium sporogenes]|uniref:glycosyltransferase n=1 Tax=Clostridium sporogenes TaxID=1509 RepID=UPI0006B29E97|nr:glycosyltransferase [Clostridium sporogenes]
MNGKKICFITCVNDDRQYEECLLYINNLYIPEGYEIDIISIKEAESMTSGYNAGMKTSDAKYKVYLHQDTYIINKNFLYDMLDVFNYDEKIGVIGVTGAKTIPASGIWLESIHKYGQVYESHTGKMELLTFNGVKSVYEEVKAIDGLIMVTQYDIPWREDIFDGWHFYDVSQSIEFSLAGYKVVVPNQNEMWCVHDCGIVNMKDGYDEYRNKFLDQYSKNILPLVSILIPTYNRPQYFREALESALNQTYRNIEIIIGDDSTNDETQKLIMKNYINKYSNIKYYHNGKNLGQFDNDLKLYDMAKGQFINYLMDDDLFELTKIEKMMNYFIQDINEEISIITSHRAIIDGNGNIKGIFGNTNDIFKKDTIIDGVELGNFILKTNFNCIGEPTTALFRKNKLNEPFGIYNNRKYGCNVDQASWFNLLSNGKVGFINKVLSYFRIHDGQQLASDKMKLLGTLDYAHEVLTAKEKGFLIENEDFNVALSFALKYCKRVIGYFNKIDKKQEFVEELHELKEKCEMLKRRINRIKEKQQIYVVSREKEVLITNNHIINYAGSEIVTLNLAKEFIRKGYKVTVGTFFYGNPMQELFEENNIVVKNLLSNEITNKKFNIIWAQHFPTLYTVLFNNYCHSDKIIINSMSPYEPLESPPVFANMLSLCIANSEETKAKLIKERVAEENLYIMPNPVEDEFLKYYDKDKILNLNKICVVSNHIPYEVYEAAKLLKKYGVQIDLFGVNDHAVYITPQLLKRYDAIITIGKTVQYGMSIGIPVYCYDRFGGPGWITNENFSRSYEFNFSGRCCNRRISSEQIFKEIIDGYKNAFKIRETFYRFACENFIISKHLNNILNIIEKKQSVNLEEIKSKYSMISRQNVLYLNGLRETHNN